MQRALTALALLTFAPAHAATNQSAAQTYGQNVLEAHAAQHLQAKPATISDLDCSVLLKLPHDIKQCTLHIWGQQATAEILYEVAGNPMNNWRRVWVGQMRGLPTDAQAKVLTAALARDYVNWSPTPAAQQWFARQTARLGPVRFGFAAPCAVFSKVTLPAGVKNCLEGPGPADGPTITLQLADGRRFEKGI